MINTVNNKIQVQTIDFALVWEKQRFPFIMYITLCIILNGVVYRHILSCNHIIAVSTSVSVQLNYIILLYRD